jgi:hypothetical protein
MVLEMACLLLEELGDPNHGVKPQVCSFTFWMNVVFVDMSVFVDGGGGVVC